MKCEKCGNVMELKDLAHEPWENRYWEGYLCSCSHVELKYYTENEYNKSEAELILKKINELEYYKMEENKYFVRLKDLTSN
jgi:hypothetical protein